MLHFVLVKIEEVQYSLPHLITLVEELKLHYELQGFVPTFLDEVPVDKDILMLKETTNSS